ncbi:MAG: radical SAM protein [Kiritimatiellae bacterium]|nr:radical SAM protein [Kiritimatiellia bacterium]
MTRPLRPSLLNIDACTLCQLRCPTCPTTGDGFKPAVGRGFLKFEDFRDLIEANPMIRRVNLQNRGEMFLHPELLSIMRYAYEKNVALFAPSGVNLNTVSEEVLEGLVKYRVRQLLCSIDGATGETYREYRVGGDLDRVLANIKTINRFKRAYHSPLPQLRWQFIVFGHNEHELPLARKMARDLDMSFAPKMSWDSNYSPIRNREFVMAETGWTAVTREEYAETRHRDYMRRVCLEIWQSPRINWNGNVLGCCWNSWREFGGNAFKDGYLASINGERLQYAREMLAGKAAPREDIPCTTCALYRRMRESSDFITMREIRPTPNIVVRFYRGVLARLLRVQSD